MTSIVQARLDDKSKKTLVALSRALGWSRSEVLREGLRIFESGYLRRKKRGVIGLGKFRSGVTDLGSNKKPLRDFGK
jgi:hypothetical protein